MHREVAIKLLISEVEEESETALARFKREMDVLIDLSHPNIVRVLDAGEMEGRLFYVMELLVARNLDSLLKENGPMPVEAVLAILDQMLDALDYVHHGRGLVHRDV